MPIPQYNKLTFTNYQFSGYSQQDSQEFLSYLLDGLHEDLNRVLQKPYVEAVEDKGRPDEIVAAESWQAFLKRNQSVIIDLLHGQFKSKLVCPDCGKISITFDPFMSISVPIPSNVYTQLPIYFIYKNRNSLPVKVTVTLPPTASTTDIKQTMAKLLELQPEQIDFNLLKEHVIQDEDVDKLDLKALKDHEAIPFAY